MRIRTTLLALVWVASALRSAPVPKIEQPALAVRLDANTIRVGDPLPVKVVFRPDQDYVTGFEMEPDRGTLFFEVCDPGSPDFVNVPPTHGGLISCDVRLGPPHKYVRGDVAASISLLYLKGRQGREESSGPVAIFAKEGTYQVRAVIPHKGGEIVSKPVEVKVQSRGDDLDGKYASEYVQDFNKVFLLRTKSDAVERLQEWLRQNDNSAMSDYVTQYLREEELEVLLQDGTDKQIKAKVDELLKLADASGSIRKDSIRLSTTGLLVGRKKTPQLVSTILEPVDLNLSAVATYLRQAKELEAKKADPPPKKDDKK